LSKASASGDLEAAIALRSEQKRFAGANGIPAEDDAADPLAVKQLRAAWRTQLPRLEKDRADRAKAMHAKYDQVLAQAQTQLTKGNRIDDALLVKAKRGEVAAAWLAGISAAPPAVAVGLPKPPATIPLKPPAGQTTVQMDGQALADKLKEMGWTGYGKKQGDGQFIVWGAKFEKQDWTREDFAIFDQLGEIEWLGFENSPVTDTLIERARVCRKVRTLALTDLPNVTGKGIQIVADMPELNMVCLHRVPIGDAAFKSAFGKSKVHAIEITDIGITDISLTTIGQMPALQLARIWSNPGLTTAGWLGLSKAGRLQRLELQDVHPGSDGFAHLAKCRSLEYLQLERLSPTDEELSGIRTMKQLRTIHFNGGKVSDDAIAALKTALPNVIINVNGTPR